MPSINILLNLLVCCAELKCGFAGFAGTDPNCIDNIGNEDFAIADLVGVSGFLDRFDGTVNGTVGEAIGPISVTAVGVKPELTGGKLPDGLTFKDGKITSS